MIIVKIIELNRVGVNYPADFSFRESGFILNFQAMYCV